MSLISFASVLPLVFVSSRRVKWFFVSPRCLLMCMCVCVIFTRFKYTIYYYTIDPTGLRAARILELNNDEFIRYFS